MRPRFIITCSALSVGAAISLILRLPTYIADYWGDWPIFWVAAHVPEQLYVRADVFAFPYPPTTLIPLVPFGALPIWISFALWSALSLATLFIAGRLIASTKAVLIAFIMPGCFVGLLAGQTGMLIGALAIAAITKRSGPLLAIGALLKPQSFVAIPFTDWDWRLAAKALVTGFIFIALTLLFWGAELWQEWLVGFSQWREVARAPRIEMLNVGIPGVAHNLNLPSWLYVFGLALGAACTWTVFRSTDDPLERYTAFACGSVLMSPYTLGYDLAGLSIASMAMLFDKGCTIWRWIAAGLIVSGAGLLVSIGVVLLAAVLLWEHLLTSGRTGPLRYAKDQSACIRSS